MKAFLLKLKDKIMDKTKCEHDNLTSNAHVGKLFENGVYKGCIVDLQIACADCQLPFQFLGLPPFRLDLLSPMCSEDGQTAYLSIAPNGSVPTPWQSALFNSITQHGPLNS